MTYVQTFRNEEIFQIEDAQGRKMHIAIGTLPATVAWKIEGKLGNILGPGVLALVAGAAGKNPTEMISDPSVVNGFVHIIKNLWQYEEDGKFIFMKFAELTKFSEDGVNWQHMNFKPDAPNSFDQVFSGRTELRYKWTIEHLKHNFSGFLDLLKSLDNGKGQGSPSPKTQE